MFKLIPSTLLIIFFCYYSSAEEKKPIIPVKKITVKELTTIKTPSQIVKSSQKVTARLAKLIALPSSMSPGEIKEAILKLILELSIDGFDENSECITTLPRTPSALCDVKTICKKTDNGVSVIRLGIPELNVSNPQLWIEAFIWNNGKKEPSPYFNKLGQRITEQLKDIKVIREKFTLSSLKKEVIKLSYVDTVTALNSLKMQGITSIKQTDKMPTKLSFNLLPLVVELQAPRSEQTTLVGGGNVNRNSMGLSMLPNAAAQIKNETVATPVGRLLVMYHPSHPEQLRKVRQMLTNIIDRASRQVLIEGLVLEISQSDLEAMGVSWSADDPGQINDKITGISGGILPNINNPSLKVGIGNIGAAQWQMQLQALISDGKAEILSRPSVLTLDNRQATIRIGNDLPVAKTVINNNNISTSFYYIPTGILLNVRPRISEDAKTVSLAVDTTVSAKVLGADLEIKDKNDVTVSQAPQISTRRVQTYAMIEDRNPFIIGGLVSRDKIKLESKIPFLGDLPYIGGFFRTQSDSDSKREVIIVLTPFVLPEKNPSWPIPKSDDMFDSFDNDLFRTNYRIRPTDVFDLDFLYANEKISRSKLTVSILTTAEPELKNRYPFSEFTDKTVPGEHILIERMLYDVVKRKKVDTLIDPERIIFLAHNEESNGLNVDFLKSKLQEMQSLEHQALVISYVIDNKTDNIKEVFKQPVPKIYFTPCADRTHWGKLLWELNQPDSKGRKRHTLVIQNEKDVARLKRSIVLKAILSKNQGGNLLSLAKFKVGKQLLMPELREDQHHMIDKDTARHFFHTEHYYAAVSETIDKAINALDKAIKDTKLQRILEVNK